VHYYRLALVCRGKKKTPSLLVGRRRGGDEVSYEFKIDHEAGVLVVKHSGASEMDEVLASRADGIPILEERGIRNVLVDLREARVTLSVAEIFEFQAAESSEFPLGTRMAMVLSPESCSEENARLAVNVATNRGFTERTFMTMDEAFMWLTADDE
jgi:hypothetical protein